MILDRIEELLKEVSELTANNAEEIEALRLKYLSRKGIINDLMADFRNVAAEEKKTVGMKINELKQKTTERINALREQTEVAENASEDIDLTRSPYPIELGTRHPLTIVKNEIIDIFTRMGFVLADGPEVEDDLHVFTKMNFAADHPARDMQDTFFVEQSETGDVTKNILLRSHTSSVQARVMEHMHTEDGKLTAPIRVICPGRVYRNEAITARAHCFFHQIEGLYIDKNVSFTDLKQVLLSFARELFGADTKIRLRPSYFPFTEPSAEMDISCHICGGKGCGFCKHTGWVEILGCGMVDPNVLELCGIDSTVYSGYAFGLGVRFANVLRERCPFPPGIRGSAIKAHIQREMAGKNCLSCHLSLYMSSHQSIISKNSSSFTILIPSFSAFCNLLGPMFSPARINEVLPLMLPTFLPPCCSMMALYSSRL